MVFCSLKLGLSNSSILYCNCSGESLFFETRVLGVVLVAENPSYVIKLIIVVAKYEGDTMANT
jgi:hypothetical protein